MRWHHAGEVFRGVVLASGKEELHKSDDKPDGRVAGKDRDMGSALRSVYQKAVDERVPDDLLALLGKLD